MIETERQQVAVLVLRLRAIGDEWSVSAAEEAHDVISLELETLANKVMERRSNGERGTART